MKRERELWFGWAATPTRWRPAVRRFSQSLSATTVPLEATSETLARAAEPLIGLPGVLLLGWVTAVSSSLESSTRAGACVGRCPWA